MVKRSELKRKTGDLGNGILGGIYNKAEVEKERERPGIAQPWKLEKQGAYHKKVWSVMCVIRYEEEVLDGMCVLFVTRIKSEMVLLEWPKEDTRVY
ncbi:hypothetical protein TNIN_32551 [Trichonephila inaurata madagascariensis]|uniref:Uncharacterized protein n=1 Tax=Trichonephila inaurata madagascariensis TaxID=2747483 RepID=A0A8X7CCQ6_9ARAC|nr:hypothetical protein TNIN_32551 [Trichonephila inaurata madagascariensis]